MSRLIDTIASQLNVVVMDPRNDWQNFKNGSILNIQNLKLIGVKFRLIRGLNFQMIKLSGEGVILQDVRHVIHLLYLQTEKHHGVQHKQ